MTLRQRMGQWLMPRLPVTRHVFNHLRLELRCLCLRLQARWNPWIRGQRRTLRQKRNLLVNVGCGPFGQPGWVNIDVNRHPGVTVTHDCRRGLPMSDGSCRGIHAEHVVEHLDPAEELMPFLRDCRRALESEGVLRVIVPDAERYVRAYLAADWSAMNQLGCGGEAPQSLFETRMDALNHVFLQQWEHYGGFDLERLSLALRRAGFTRIRRLAWREGDFPGGCIDREQHRPYSLYVEARP